MTDSAVTPTILLPDLFPLRAGVADRHRRRQRVHDQQPAYHAEVRAQDPLRCPDLIASKMGVKGSSPRSRNAGRVDQELYEKTREGRRLPTYGEAMEMGRLRAEPEGRDHRVRGVSQRSGSQPLHPYRQDRDLLEIRWPASRHRGLGEEDLHFAHPVYTHGFTETDVPHRRVPPCVAAASTIAVARRSSWGGIELLKESTRRRRGSTPPTRRSAASAGRQDPREERVRRNRLLAKVTPRVVPSTDVWPSAGAHGTAPTCTAIASTRTAASTR